MNHLVKGATTGQIVAAVNKLIDLDNEAQEALEASILAEVEEYDRFEDELEEAVLTALAGLSHYAIHANDEAIAVCAAEAILVFDIADTDQTHCREYHGF